MSMRLVFNEWPEGREVTEVYFTKIEGERAITQGQSVNSVFVEAGAPSLKAVTKVTHKRGSVTLV